MQEGSKAAMSSGERVAENVIGARHQVAALVPCYNEEHAVAKMAADFRAALLVGLILDTVTRGRRELKLVAYLAPRAPGEEWRRT
jgi:hypothetical protein